ncbi:MAG: cysteine--tRNA ligase [Chloroflexi bacterium]|nr:cysteine--tRNA ligase [Chloroflexota bacterium]
MSLRIFNTLSGRAEVFEPLGTPVRIYCCGMTPKFHPHIGHARLFVDVDFMRRTLEHLGYEVRHVQNFTDIDDKTILRAEEEGITAEEVARKYTESYFASMAQLAVKPADEYPTVTGYMERIIQFVERLVEKGFGYVVGGDVWFSVSRFPDYGKLSGRAGDAGLIGVRKDLEPGKRDPRDFALWKAAKPGEPSWRSPWGPGRPGWHIECSTMVRETLGDQIDIHCGAEDLIFPHHENEIAQSEALTGLEPFAKYWPHVGWVTAEGEKMSHSLWNFVTLQDVLERFDPAAVRLFLLQTHYRSPLAFSEEGLAASSRSLPALRAAYGQEENVPGVAEISSESALHLLQRFDAQLEDDFNSPGAVGVMFETAHEVNRASDADRDQVRAVLRRMVEVLGLPLSARRSEPASTETILLIEFLIELRAELRQEKQWVLADKVRDGLKALGIVLKDGPQGTIWEREDREGRSAVI